MKSMVRDKRSVLFTAEPKNKYTYPFFFCSVGEGIPLFCSPNPRYCSQVWVLIYRNPSIITYTTGYDYNDHKGDINRKTTIMIITQ